jgi:hypothetical protein
VAGRWPKRRPLKRAARYEGLFPIDLPGPEALAELADEIAVLREGNDGHFDLVAEHSPGDDPAPWAAAGATWCLTSFGMQPTRAEVEAAIDAGP